MTAAESQARRLSYPLAATTLGALLAAACAAFLTFVTDGGSPWVSALILATATAGGLIVDTVSTAQPEAMREDEPGATRRKKTGLDIISGVVGGLLVAVGFWFWVVAAFSLTWVGISVIILVGLGLIALGIAGIRWHWLVINLALSAWP
ncbi:hypothetical protein [Leifsonia sp. Leaf264]|uniref:hypothetical protein n=1 Tax=Leifsonia sp. Leaf264 TaxID=1736314 RepID=UPI0006F631D8|nr:hypothetical protein [Leifsonia sp. Leaf264]KQO98439.1 hypothetical protein ASF30_10280 [Leifsonia sp. Leaf264]